VEHIEEKRRQARHELSSARAGDNEMMLIGRIANLREFAIAATF
jgi:hypothetical protein